MTAMTLSPYRVEAFNTAKASENKIHDDAVARQLGFARPAGGGQISRVAGGGIIPSGGCRAGSRDEN